jgi:hypothetical protein
MNGTIAATLIGTAVGTSVWLFGIGDAIWPSHPLIMVFLITVAVGVVVKRTWPVHVGEKKT